MRDSFNTAIIPKPTDRDAYKRASCVLFWLGVAIVFILLLAGCKATSFSTTSKDGTVTKASDRRLFISTGADFNYEVATNGTRKISATVQSSPATEAIKAAASGAAEGVTRAFKP